MHNLLQGIEFNKNTIIAKYNKFYDIQCIILNGDFGEIFRKSPKRDKT